MQRNPLVSVVMPSFNQAEFIGRAIESVFGQDHTPLELIIMDGGSTDRTLDILTQKAAQYPGLRWTSEPDNGPAHAINKALDQVRGEYVGWLNSDDLYADSAVTRALRGFDAHPDWIMCYGDGEHIDVNDHVIGPYPTSPPGVGIQAFAEGCFICQPTMFFKTSLLALLGKLDETQKTSFDYEYWLRAFQAFPERIGFVEAVQAQSRLHEDCITQNLRRTIAVEGVRLGKKYLGRGHTHWLDSYFREARSDFDSAEAFHQHAEAMITELTDCFSAEELVRLRAVIA